MVVFLGGNWAERRRLLTHTLKLWRKQGDDHLVALTLGALSDANRYMGFLEEGIKQAREASEIFQRRGDLVDEARNLITLAYALHDDQQLDAAEETASRVLDLLPEKGEQSLHRNVHRILGNIYRSKGNTEGAIHYYEVVLGIGSPFNWHGDQFWVHFALAELFCKEGRLNDAHARVECAKLHAVNDTYLLARASRLQAGFWRKQRMFEEAKSEALRALHVFEKLGAANNAEETRQFLGRIDRDARGDGLG